MQPDNVLSRRDFLKLASLTSLTWFASPLAGFSPQTTDEQRPNVIILVFDAWSARHLQFYGYPRRTMPNLERFLEKATVFHNHYAAGTFTIPGTASLLTGTYPWTHRALSLGSGGISDAHLNHQLFTLLSDTHSTLAYTQNKFADLLLYQFTQFIDTHLQTGEFNLGRRFIYNAGPFENDIQVAFASLENNELLDGENRTSSLFINPLFRLWKMSMAMGNDSRFAREYPLGLPDDTEQFLLSDVIDGAIRTLQNLEEPGSAYLHFYPPHENYRPTQNFYKKFKDGWQPLEKPIHRLSWGRFSYPTLRQLNREYDEYIASWDAEVNRLFQFLQDSGLLDRSYVILTADHGELNERGERGHFSSMIFEPLIHIPLILFQPGQESRRDVYANTSATDILPTVAHLLGKPAPDWVDGQVLPGLGGEEDPERGIYSMDAKSNASFAPLTQTSVSLTKNRHRLTYYDYPDHQQFEFYDLEDDREEMNDLYPSQPALARQMKDELLQKLAEINRAQEL
jgi:arylsulfatase A-like enzyme